MAELPKLNVVIANNFGHLPMFIGAEKGYFKQHGVDASFRVVDTGTDMVNALHNGEAQVGDMSTTTYLKAVHAGNPFQVIGLIMNDATNDRCDTPLAIVTKKGRGINVGKIGDVRGKAVLVRTDFSRHWGTDSYFSGNPYLTAEACEALVEAGAAFDEAVAAVPSLRLGFVGHARCHQQFGTLRAHFCFPCHEKRRADEQHQRQRNFRHHQHIAQHAIMPPGTATSALFEHIVQIEALETQRRHGAEPDARQQRDRDRE